jgi:2'-5' RNA ligase
MRLFLAVELPQEVREHLLKVRQTLEGALPKVSYTRGENLHLTLKFLGDVEPKRVDAITESLGHIKSPQFELFANAIECFPHRGPIKVITAALDGTLPPLRALVESIEQRCKFLGFEKEQRGFRPHVTFARARPVLSQRFRTELEEATSNLWPGPSFSTTEFVQMESQLHPQGSIYKPLARFPLG